MVKTKIDINVKVKVKNIELNEYEMVMDTWRASMLFFERELRRLNYKNKLSDESLKRISKNIDFTELLRLNFLSISDQKRMKLVKLAEVSDAIQRVQNVESTIATSNVPIYQKDTLPRFDPTVKNLDVLNEQTVTQEVSNQSILNMNQSVNIPDAISENPLDYNIPQIDVNAHASILNKNTASAVVELRKMMYNNLQKIRKTLGEVE